MSDRPEQRETLWHPPANPNEWRKISTPTRKRRRVKVRPTLPENVPQQAEQTGGWHLPTLSETTARPAPKQASPEELALGLVPDEPTAPAPEDSTPDAPAGDARRPEDSVPDDTDETQAAAPLRPEDLELEDTAARQQDEPEDEAYTQALDELEDDEEGAFTMSELLALQNLADATTGADVSQGEALDLDVQPSDVDDEELNPESLSPAERAAMGLETDLSKEGASADEFDYASQLAALQGDDDQQTPGTDEQATEAVAQEARQDEAASADEFDYASQLAALQGDDTGQPGAQPTGQADDSDPQSYAQQQLASLQGGDPYADTQTLGNTPSYGQQPAVDAEQEAFARKFQETERQVRELRAQRDAGQLPPAQFESALRELMIFDESEGVYWMMGADTDIWYKYDQDQGQWIVADPPVPTGQQPQQQPYEQNILTPDSGMREVGDLDNALPRVEEEEATDWGYSQPADAQPAGGQQGEGTAQPNFEDSYQMPQAVPARDEAATMVGDAAFKDQLTGAAATTPSMGAVEDDDGYQGVEGALETAPDYDAQMGDDLSSEMELAKRRRQRQLITTIAATVGIVTGVVLLAAAGIIFYVYSQYQGIKTQWEEEIAAFGAFETDFQTVIIQDVTGEEIARLRSQDGGDRTNIELANISPEMIHATVSTENERFFSDPGWDPIAIARAFLTNLAAGEVVSGGSTITQQLAENIILRNNEEASFASPAQAKLNEIVISHELAQRYSKERILEVYLNEVYFGNQKYGVEAAAEFYFDKPADSLNLAESALLAGLIQAPAANDPVTNPGAAFNRLDEVVRLMQQAGNGSGCLPLPFQQQPFCVTQATLEGQAAINIAEVKTTIYLPEETSIAYPHFVTFVQQQLQTQFTQEEIFRRGFVVRTTLRPDIQDNAQANLEDYVDSIGTTNVNTGTAMVTNPDTGAILAMIGSPDFNDESIDGQVNLALSWQQPGSAIKPVTYAAALWDPLESTCRHASLSIL